MMILTYKNESLVEVKHEFQITMKIFLVSKHEKILLFHLQITLVLIRDSLISVDLTFYVDHIILSLRL